MFTGFLLGNTSRLKQLIREHGQIWYTESCKPTPKICFNGADGFLIVSEDNRHTRNIRAEDFQINCLL